MKTVVRSRDNSPGADAVQRDSTRFLRQKGPLRQPCHPGRGGSRSSPWLRQKRLAERTRGAACHRATAPAALAITKMEPSGKPSARRSGAGLLVGQHDPDVRGKIGLGSIVLVHESPEDSWWEAEIIGVEGPVLDLRWVGWPTSPTIIRRLTSSL